MDGLAKWLSDISWPIVSRVLAALGVGTVTYTGVTEGLNNVLGSAKAATQGILPVAAQLAARAGFFDYMSITSGGLVAGISWLVLKHFALQTGTASQP